MKAPRPAPARRAARTWRPGRGAARALPGSPQSVTSLHRSWRQASRAGANPHFCRARGKVGHQRPQGSGPPAPAQNFQAGTWGPEVGRKAFPGRWGLLASLGGGGAGLDLCAAQPVQGLAASLKGALPWDPFTPYHPDHLPNQTQHHRP